MSGTTKCPFCGSPALTGCAHLALAAKQTEFVTRCIEKSQANSHWQKLIAQSDQEGFREVYGEPDFVWLETDFQKFFLADLRWFGGMDFEWRAEGGSRRGDMFVLLWSKDPQRLWWELCDQLAGEAENLLEQQAETTVRCPVCGTDAAEECEHLAFHGDDLRTAEVLGQKAWARINKLSPGHLPEFAAALFEEYAEHFPSLEEVTSASWEGGAPGLSGVYAYVWEKEDGKLQDEINAFVKAQLAG